MKINRSAFSVFVVVAVFGYPLYLWLQGPVFDDADIENCKESIKNLFEQRPMTRVSNVTLIKESNKKLIGFVKLTVDGTDFTKSCSADMGEKGYIWRCN